MSMILRVAAEGSWDDAKQILKDAAKRAKLTVTERGSKELVITNSSTGDYGEFSYRPNGAVSAHMFEEGSSRPFSKGEVSLSSFKDKDDWKEKLGFFVQSIEG